MKKITFRPYNGSRLRRNGYNWKLWAGMYLPASCFEQFEGTDCHMDVDHACLGPWAYPPTRAGGDLSKGLSTQNSYNSSGPPVSIPSETSASNTKEFLFQIVEEKKGGKQTPLKETTEVTYRSNPEQDSVICLSPSQDDTARNVFTNWHRNHSDSEVDAVTPPRWSIPWTCSDPTIFGIWSYPEWKDHVFNFVEWFFTTYGGLTTPYQQLLGVPSMVGAKCVYRKSTFYPTKRHESLLLGV